MVTAINRHFSYSKIEFEVGKFKMKGVALIQKLTDWHFCANLEYGYRNGLCELIKPGETTCVEVFLLVISSSTSMMAVRFSSVVKLLVTA